MYPAARLLVILLILLPSLSHSDDCFSWFSNLNIREHGTLCEQKCSSSQVDMATFGCPSRCKKFCEGKKKCKTNPKWKKVLSDFMYFRDDDKKIKTEKFTTSDIKNIEKTLSNFSDNLIFNDLKIVKMKEDYDPLSATNSSKYVDGHIILFSNAFQNIKQLKKYLTHELSHHIHAKIDKNLFEQYKKETGWSDHKKRTGSFLDHDSQFSPEEDFATNLEKYILSPKKLEKQIPKIYKWMKKHIKNRYKPKDCK